MKNGAGNPAYNPIILFKMLILQIGYGALDESVEDRVNEHLSASVSSDDSLEDRVNENP